MTTTDNAGQRWGVWYRGREGFEPGWVHGAGGHSVLDNRVDACALCTSMTDGRGPYFEVRPYPGPAAAAVCSECKAAPCDCEKEIWTYWHRSHGDPISAFPTGARRAAAAMVRECSERDAPSIPRGPVQRVSDPPYDFGKTSETTTPAPNRALEEINARWRKGPEIDPAALARALFEIEMLTPNGDDAISEAERYSEWIAAPGMARDEEHDVALHRVLEVMWTKTKPDVRKRCERLAEGVCARMGRKA